MENRIETLGVFQTDRLALLCVLTPLECAGGSWHFCRGKTGGLGAFLALPRDLGTAFCLPACAGERHTSGGAEGRASALSFHFFLHPPIQHVWTEY